jgi:ketosteroid isomerase-like protein
VSREETDLVSKMQALLPEGDLKSVLLDDSFQASVAEIMDPEAEIRFVDAEGGALGDFRPMQRGAEGLRSGWREWLEPWEEFRVELDEILTGAPGTVVWLVVLHGRVPDGPEIRQPGAAVVGISDGLIASMDFYMDQDQARRDAGL